LGVGTALQYSAGFFLVCAAPLFEEEGDFGGEGLVAYVDYPVGLDWSCVWAGFAADDDPVNALEVDIRDWAEEGFERDEFERGGGLS